MEKRIICIMCPLGCRGEAITGPGGKMSLRGFECKEGRKYAGAEAVQSLRILTATVVVASGPRALLPVRTDKAIAKEKLKSCMEELARVRVTPPVEAGQVIVADICGTGANLVACRALSA